jgi:hypothetical protein
MYVANGICAVLRISLEMDSVAGVIVWGSPCPVIGQRLDWTPSTRELTLLQIRGGLELYHDRDHDARGYGHGLWGRGGCGDLLSNKTNTVQYRTAV